MEKICIAKRRIASREGFDHSIISKGEPEISRKMDSGEELVSVRLPIEDGTVTQSNPGERVTSDGIRYEMNRQKDGMLVLNIYLNKTDLTSTRLLKTPQVCQMLQVGKKALLGLVRTGHLKSYLICSRRRFLLSDVLDYLTRVKEHYDLDHPHGISGGGITGAETEPLEISAQHRENRTSGSAEEGFSAGVRLFERVESASVR